ncbi:MAG TPA: hypothetical protein PKJ63_06965 [Cyclobacteriaceae bacterium]|nr:hypothetical protein [Cyclobacteriaceae bacterium]
MRYLLALGLTISVFAAQCKEPMWYEGVVVLESGELIKGNLSFPSFELVFAVTEQGERIALPANKIKLIRCYDPLLKANRRFDSFPVDEGYLQTRKLFEVVVKGTVSVLRRPVNLYREISEIDHLDYNYYFVTASQSIKEFRDFASDGLSQMKIGVGDVITDYIRENHLRPNQMADIIMIVKFYNELSNTPQVVAGPL